MNCKNNKLKFSTNYLVMHDSRFKECFIYEREMNNDVLVLTDYDSSVVYYSEEFFLK